MSILHKHYDFLDLAVDVRVHGVMGSEAEVLGSTVLVQAVWQIPGVHVALHVPGEQPVGVHGDAPHLDLVLQGPETGSSGEAPQPGGPVPAPR